jgi:hypothetical protein
VVDIDGSEETPRRRICNEISHTQSQSLVEQTPLLVSGSMPKILYISIFSDSVDVR